MSWTDRAPASSMLRYKVRRESVDARYRWESRIVRTPVFLTTLLARPDRGLPIGEHGVLELTNAAAGPLELRLYDLQGRVVLQQQGTATGSGDDTIRFDLDRAARPVSNGIYFAIVRDAAGQTSEPAKIVVLR